MTKPPDTRERAMHRSLQPQQEDNLGHRADRESTTTQPHNGLQPCRRDAACVAIVVLAVSLMGIPGITTGGLGWSDAPNHTMDGIFILEFIKATPLEAPLQWAEQFYLRYPALGILVYWPPGFALVEAGLFAALGTSIVTARLTVLLFAVGASILMVHLGKRWFDRTTGLLSALLLITCPHGALWLRDVMLEWPATFWILAAITAYQKYRDTRAARWAVTLTATLVMGFLTKQTIVFIIPVLLMHGLLTQQGRTHLRRPAFSVAVSIAIAFVLGYVLLTRNIAALPAQLIHPSFDIGFYPRHLPEILGWPFLPIAVLGLGTLIVAPDRQARGFLLLWFLVWTVFCMTISAKEPRYFFFALPPLCFAAARFFTRPIAATRREQALTARGKTVAPASRRWFSRPGTAFPSRCFPFYHGLLTWRHDAPRLVLLAALVVVQATLAHRESTGHLPSYADAVAELTQRPDADLVLIDAVRDGQFVFDVYQDPHARKQIIPLRASKLLYARAARMQYSPQVFVESKQDIIQLLDRYGIRYIIAESSLPRTSDTGADPLPRRLLRTLLSEDPRFVLVKTWPLRCGDPAWEDVELRLFAYPDCPARTKKDITLPFPAMDRDVTFRLP